MDTSNPQSNSTGAPTGTPSAEAVVIGLLCARMVLMESQITALLTQLAKQAKAIADASALLAQQTEAIVALQAKVERPAFH